MDKDKSLQGGFGVLFFSASSPLFGERAARQGPPQQALLTTGGGLALGQEVLEGLNYRYRYKWRYTYR